MSQGRFSGAAGYVALMASLRDAPCAISDFRDRHGLTYCGSYAFMMGLKALGRVHISGWVLRHRVKPLAVFSFGKGIDVPPPKTTLKGLESKGARLPRPCNGSASLVAVEYAIREMELQPTTALELSAATGIHRASMRTLIRAFVKHGFAHIGAWERSHNGPPLPAYSFGRGRNAERPKPMPRKIINARYWAKRREAEKFAPLQQAFAMKEAA